MRTTSGSKVRATATAPRQVDRQQGLLAHHLVRAERDADRHLGGPAGERVTRDPQQQRQGAGPGAVRHDQAHARPVEVGPGQAVEDETADLLGVSRSPAPPSRRAAAGSPGSVPYDWEVTALVGVNKPHPARFSSVGTRNPTVDEAAPGPWAASR